MSWIETYSGEMFEPLSPKPETVHILDIAHALSNTCRFNGHCEFFFSVAQHSINCAKQAQEDGMPPLIQFYCLMHDASEAYICDICRPIKPFLENYLDIEDGIMSAIWQAFDVPEPDETDWEYVKLVDNRMLANEAGILMKCKNWNHEEYEKINNAKFLISEKRPMIVSNEFLQMFQEILLNYIASKQM